MGWTLILHHQSDTLLLFMSTTTFESISYPPVNDPLVARIVRRIVEAFHPRRIVLFGSRARGMAGPESDVDLLIEMETDLPKWKRRIMVDEIFGLRDWAMDLLVLTPLEIERERTFSGSIIHEVDHEGVVLYERG